MWTTDNGEYMLVDITLPTNNVIRLIIILRIQERLVFATIIRCYRLRLWVGCFFCFKITSFLLMDVLYSIKEINSLRKEIVY